jgi:hypothetical protein
MGYTYTNFTPDLWGIHTLIPRRICTEEAYYPAPNRFPLSYNHTGQCKNEKERLSEVLRILTNQESEAYSPFKSYYPKPDQCPCIH